MKFRKPGPVKERFLKHVSFEPNSGCWLWTAGLLGKKGYGSFKYNRMQFYAHRASYDMFCEPIPDGLLVLHKCDVRLCVNPDHLFLGTVKDNSDDMIRKGSGNHPKGERCPGSKLTEKDILEIRQSTEMQSVLAERYKVTQVNISIIKLNKSWRHI